MARLDLGAEHSVVSANSLFMSSLISAYPTDAPDPFYAKVCDTFSSETRYNVIFKRVFTAAMDEDDTATVSFGATSGSYLFAILIVKGCIRLNSFGLDTDNATAITGYTPVYGTELYPGILMLSTYNLNASTIATCLQDGTTAEIFTASLAED